MHRWQTFSIMSSHSWTSSASCVSLVVLLTFAILSTPFLALIWRGSSSITFRFFFSLFCLCKNFFTIFCIVQHSFLPPNSTGFICGSKSLKSRLWLYLRAMQSFIPPSVTRSVCCSPSFELSLRLCLRMNALNGYNKRFCSKYFAKTKNQESRRLDERDLRLLTH